MYFKEKLSIAPSQPPRIEKLPPDPGIKRILYDVVGGVYGEKI